MYKLWRDVTMTKDRAHPFRYTVREMIRISWVIHDSNSFINQFLLIMWVQADIEGWIAKVSHPKPKEPYWKCGGIHCGRFTTQLLNTIPSIEIKTSQIIFRLVIYAVDSVGRRCVLRSETDPLQCSAQEIRDKFKTDKLYATWLLMKSLAT